MKYDLSQILKWIGIDSPHLDIEINGLSDDSRTCKPGDLYFALNGFNYHGFDFAYQAQRIGAKAILAEIPVENMAKPKSRREPLNIPVIEIKGLSEKLGEIASEFYQRPSSQLNMLGITGTNGKTSSAWIMTQILEKTGSKSAYIGTLGYGTSTQLQDLKNTTPSSLTIQKILFDFVKQGIEYVSMEVSSHGLDQNRCSGIKFDTVGFTNISHDHLDYHKTIENYAKAKERIFGDFKGTNKVLNINDDFGKKWKEKYPNALTYGINSKEADFNAENITLSTNGISFELVAEKNNSLINSKLLGEFNVENLLLVIAMLRPHGFKIEQLIPHIENIGSVMGRMNQVSQLDSQPTIVVDYAHTPDALEQVLKTLKKHKPNKIWCVFGCGGNRDKTKRPMMGYIAESFADHVIITNDNPRFEASETIVADIVMGMKTKASIILDRKEAIAYAVENAQPQDIILVAGKGHETYQEIEGTRYPFDDTNVALNLLEAAA